MEKFFKENWFKLSIVAILLIAALSAIYYFFFFVPIQENNKVQVSDGAQETSCAKQAQIVLENEQKKDASVNYSQSNHYNRSLKKCLINLFSSGTSASEVLFTTEVRDAFEQKPLISCASGSFIKKPYCFIPAIFSNAGKAIFMTEEEGNAQIRDYMNN